MPSAGSQICICDMPVRFDTYKGFTHACKYCFATRKTDITKVEKKESATALISFIQGKRGADTNWCDWNIPIHWGGMSDPFMPQEKQHRYSYECLKVFAETKYPVVISTKGRLVIDDEYLELLHNCNVVLQISLVSPKYDKIELGCPTFKERVAMLHKLSPHVKRLIVRVQPYMREALLDILANIPRYKDAGVYGITIEGMKFFKQKPGLEKIGADFAYPKQVLERDFSIIKKKAHDYGLQFLVGENRLRSMSDHLNCCGAGNLEGFIGNSANFNHYFFDHENFKYTKQMEQTGTAEVFRASLGQDTATKKTTDALSYKQLMENALSDKKYVSDFLGIRGK